MAPPRYSLAVVIVGSPLLEALLNETASLHAQEALPPSSCADVESATTRGCTALAGSSRAQRMGCAAAPARKGKLVLVGRVIDGDTIVIAGGERVRYIGIGAPAVGTDGEEAASLNRDLVEHRYVRLLSEVTDRDTFGRLLRYVMVDGVLVEAKLVREGLWPVPVDYHPGQPHAACVAPLEEEARSLGRGIWRSSR